MRTKLRSRLMLLFMSLAMVIAFPAVALADQIANTLDNTVDTAAENMPLTEGGSAGTTKIYVNPANGDGKGGCNLTGSSSISVSVASSNTNVATVSPSSFNLNDCNEKNGQTITVTPVKAGSATITVSGPNSITVDGEKRTFTYGEGTFNVTVAGPANTAPGVSVTGVSDKSQYEYGSVPKAQCSVVDKEDGNKTFDAPLSAISGPLASYRLGNQTASCEYTDAGGLKASAAATYEIIDTQAPVIVDKGATALPDGDNGWYKGAVNNQFAASDNVALADTSQASFTRSSGTAEGGALKINSDAVVKDVVGNVAVNIDSAAFKVDRTAPVISGQDINDTTWRNSNLSQSFTASDATSGLSNGADASFNLTVSAESANANTPTTNSKRVTDAAGNSATRSLSALIDKTAPSIKDDGPTTGANAAGWYSTNVTNNFSASDALSGLAGAADASISKSTQGEGRALTVSSGAVADAAGNMAASIDSQGFDVDKTAPTNVAGTSDRVPNANGWYNSAVTVSFAGDDALSGIANCSTDTYKGPDSANASVSGSCSDLAGNSANGSFGLKYDTTLPTLSPSVSPNPVLLNGSATATSGAQDNLSGLASQGCDPVNTGSVGAKSVSCSATDNAGNSANANASYNVTYDFKGFFQPIDNKDANGNLIFNKAKAGSTIPVKFSLGGNQGMDILAATPSTVSVNAPASATTDLIEETTTATSGLKYDAVANQYVYNWKTNSAWAGTSRQLSVKLADGTIHKANFTFTK